MTEIEETPGFPKLKKPVRSWSGVLVITVVMRPDKFSCPHNCYYCPNEPGQPRSYVSTEPAVMRANENDFDAVKQFNSRLDCLKNNGHELDKIEIIVLGGTFSAYPKDYQEEFCRDLFYAANTFQQPPIRGRKSIKEEQQINETTRYRIIGISLETRPDHIRKGEIKRLRKYGCTRVQLGIQHTDPEILKLVNRGHTIEQGVEAIKMLKNAGFKVDIHVMPDLPGTTPEKDRIMIEKVIISPDYGPDYMKIYPCLDVNYTEIREWKKDGRWNPYAETDFDKLIDLVVFAKRISKQWIRFNRIQRDFPPETDARLGYASQTIKPNLRQFVKAEAAKRGIVCQCIRCREVKKHRFQKPAYTTQYYRASDGDEYFISANSVDDQTLYGFIRLRLAEEAFIRELHVYGFVTVTGKKANKVQHQGIGKELLRRAEFITRMKGYTVLKIISGVGVREYYRRRGYQFVDDDGQYMVKELDLNDILIVYIKWLFNHMLDRMLSFLKSLKELLEKNQIQFIKIKSLTSSKL